MPDHWQHFDPTKPAAAPDHYAAQMPDGSYLTPPLRDLGDTAVAGLIATQASFQVADRLSDWITDTIQDLRPDIVAGLPTLGHIFAAAVARRLGHPNWVALGTTRKLWYDEALSAPLHSITAPAAGRRLWLDPRMLPRLQDRRVLLVDDVISTGTSAIAGLQVLPRSSAAHPRAGSPPNPPASTTPPPSAQNPAAPRNRTHYKPRSND
jgi:adenine/guanine phosphoribosyltransferase-like PRPP-binding protein